MNDSIRQQFPSLQRLHNEKPMVFLDGPAGTQVPQSVIDAISGYYYTSNANTHGAFLFSRETDQVMESARQKTADFLGAAGPECISFGQNMTSLNYSLARGIGRYLQAGDEILITQLDHEANRGPWLSLRELGVKVREIKLLPTGHLDYHDLADKLNERTRLVAMGVASNIIGTINDIQLARKLTHQVGAWLLLDAVHYAPHFPIDVVEIGCDFLLCSAYKFYGPHVGILYAKPGLLNRIPTDRLRTADQHAPYSIETGTMNHAAIAGVGAAIDFIASLGNGSTYRAQLESAMKRISIHERHLAESLYKALQKLSQVEVIGTSFNEEQRAPTLSFTFKGKTPAEVCAQLAQENIFAWDGHFYAIRSTEVLGLLEKGGVTRVGMSVYSKESDVDQLIKSLQKLTV